MGGMAGAGWTIHAMLTLGIIMAIYRLRREVDVDEMSALRG